MRKKIIICALSVFLLILSGVLAFYLHGQKHRQCADDDL